MQVIPWPTSFLLLIQSSRLLPLQALESSPSSQKLGKEDGVGGPYGPGWAGKWLLSFPPTFLWLELSLMAVLNYKGYREM